MSTKRAIALLAIILLLALVLKLSNKDTDRSMDERDDGSKLQNTSELKLNDSKRSARRNQAANTSTAEPTHSYGELKDFIIPILVLENATFTEALKQLRERYMDICLRTGEKPIPFEFHVEAESERRINVTLKQLPFTSMLKTLAAIEGVTMEMEGLDITFSPKKKSGMLMTKNFSLPARLLGKLDNATDAKSIMALLNIENAKMSYLAANGSLEINADSTDLERISQLIDHYLAVPINSVKSSSEIITVDKGVDFDPSKLNDPGYMEQIKSTQGISLSASPSVISRSGSPTTISIGTEVQTDQGANQLKGFEISSQASFTGFVVRNVAQFNHGAETGNERSPVVQNKITQDDYIPRGGHQVIRLNSSNGTTRYLIVRHTEVDATGKTVPRSR
ncbi:hypothetical protein NT6N_06550 [Oceaniferula spumae]|uniref:NolW-like domain-containing protein n=1 Tax=Oceaniferula spumae TaxID=2979115 RepID=A0AAT9FHV4_9BACT